MTAAVKHPWLKGVYALSDLLINDPDINKRTVDIGTKQERVVDTQFFQFLSFEEIFLKLEETTSKPPVRFPTPLISPYFRGFFNITRPGMSARKFDANLKIDIVTSHIDLLQAKLDGVILCHDIDATIEQKKNLGKSFAICEVEKIEEIGYRKEINFPYEYFFTIHLHAIYGS